ncbi:hypothetical protein XELAEV_18002622mg [Xenopus laevis]|uniref:Uncharacterized protein n=1 Tax=Xenopus laevis TaxID=8355 RepID=A0A974BNW6_XENLA|nr:hypothetical protein XELAEV_18002622mg [Xenopus laevis]
MLFPAAPGRAADVRLPVLHMQRWWSRSWRERLVEDETCASISLSPHLPASSFPCSPALSPSAWGGGMESTGAGAACC